MVSVVGWGGGLLPVEGVHVIWGVLCCAVLCCTVLCCAVLDEGEASPPTHYEPMRVRPHHPL